MRSSARRRRVLTQACGYGTKSGFSDSPRCVAGLPTKAPTAFPVVVPEPEPEPYYEIIDPVPNEPPTSTPTTPPTAPPTSAPSSAPTVPPTSPPTGSPTLPPFAFECSPETSNTCAFVPCDDELGVCQVCGEGGECIVGRCFCDDLCVGIGDCCPDACELCGSCESPSSSPTSSPTAPPTDTPTTSPTSSPTPFDFGGD